MGIGAVLTGLAAIIAAAAGVLLAIRAARSKERRAAAAELTELSGMLADERHARVHAEAELHAARVELARHGLLDDDDAD